MSTLREIRDEGWELTIYCDPSSGAPCHHSWRVNWDQMIQYFGYDFDPYAEREALLSRLKCEKCGRKCATTIWQPPDTYGVMMRGMQSHNHTPPSPEELAAMRETGRQVEAATARQVEEAQQTRKRIREAEKAKRDRESGKDPIGPPNPWAGRKSGRWL